MRLRLLSVPTLALLALTGCTSTGGFELGIDLAEQRVDGNPVGGLLGGFFEVPIPLMVDLAAETAARDTGPAQRVRLVELSLAITPTAESEGDTDDFGFLDGAEIFVESADAGSSLRRQRIATLEEVPEGARELFFATDPEVDLLPYIDEGARLTSSAEGTVPPDDVTFDGRAVLSVEVL
ncbi:MAG TPA: hypothetical protein RMH99_29815 [Sandaracinaceae bacterium LLY-WYZ-13_1]|nr:hypothetical protein [Sandaracinaceae bacterium LLY-WYZ-13_1]